MRGFSNVGMILELYELIIFHAPAVRPSGLGADLEEAAASAFATSSLLIGGASNMPGEGGESVSLGGKNALSIFS